MVGNESGVSRGKYHIESFDFSTAVCHCERDVCHSQCLIGRSSAKEEFSICLGQTCGQSVVKFRGAEFLERPLLAAAGRSCQKEAAATPVSLGRAGTELLLLSVAVRCEAPL